MSLKSIAKRVLPSSIWSQLRSAKIRKMIESHESYVRQGTYCNHTLKVSIEDPLSRGWYDND